MKKTGVQSVKSRMMYLNGKMVQYENALIHVHAGALKYGASVFEGLRAHWNEEKQELYVFRLNEHCERLMSSMRMMRMESELSFEELRESVLRVLRENKFREDVHIRQSAYIEEDGLITSKGASRSCCGCISKKNEPIGRRYGVCFVLDAHC